MNTLKSAHTRQQMIYAVAAIAGLILMLVWMQGGFVSKTAPGTRPTAQPGLTTRPATAQATLQTIDEIMTWPANVSARSVAQIAPKITARIVAIPVKAGDRVKAGQILARLDAGAWQAGVEQARAALAAAQAQATRAQADAVRTQNLYDQQAATQQALEAALAAARSNSAQVTALRAALSEAESHLTDTTLTAPFDGEIVQRLLEPGDTAMPGAALLVLQSGSLSDSAARRLSGSLSDSASRRLAQLRLRVEAAVPEHCARFLKPGDSLQARIDEQSYPAVLEEIAPAADPASHTVFVKAGLDTPADVQPGTYARLEQACGQRTALLIPAAAVSRSGQLESVRLLEADRVILRHVRTGKVRDGQVEILAGLAAGDVVMASSR